ncbi:hypothetical protein KR018_000839 [Drosophila ironensis]|nr:hypothetical protein KR018_000839 [Drosophila ironensis]
MSSKSWTIPRLSHSGPGGHPLMNSVRLTYAICAFTSSCLHATAQIMLGMVILKMVKHRSPDLPDSPGYLLWTRRQELTFPGIYYYGYVVSIILSGTLADRYSSKYLLILSHVLEAFLYLLIPDMARHSFNAVAGNLICCGLVAGVGSPARFKLFVTWAHPTERTSLVAFGCSGILVGTMLAYPLGCFLSELGWEVPFYVVGVVDMTFGLACFWLVYDSVEQHPRIKPDEIEYLQQGSLLAQQSECKGVPWRKLMCSGPVYAFLFTHMFHCYTFVVLGILMPRFLHEAMDFDLRELGLLASLPFLGALGSKAVCVLGASYVERHVGPDQNWMRRLVYGVCSLLTAAFIGVIIMADSEDKALVLGMFVLVKTTTDLGFNCYWPTLLYIAPSFAGLLSGLANGMAHLSGFLAPLLVASVVATGTKAEWNLGLATLMAFNVLAMVVFVLFSSTSLQSWDPSSGSKNRSTEANKEDI